jgi:hypothetical protein
MPRCIAQILSAIKDGQGQLFVSYLQIYCESISDLLVNQVSEISVDTPSGTPSGTVPTGATPVGVMVPIGATVGTPVGVWLFSFTYALLVVVYVSHAEDRFFNTPRL